MDLPRLFAQFRVGMTHTSSWASPIMFAETTYLAMAAAYGWFSEHVVRLPFFVYLMLGFIPLGSFFIFVSLWSGSTRGTYGREIDIHADRFLERLAERGYHVVRFDDSESDARGKAAVVQVLRVKSEDGKK